MLAPLTDADPRTVGRYRLQGRLGVGGMGAVYLGFDAGGQPSAVKVIRPDLVGDAQFRDRFRREVAAARRVRGGFVAEVRDADLDAPSPWMATEYVDGVSLAAAVAARDRLEGPMLMGFASGLADSLVAIHAAGLVHRDLKPSNILLAWDGPKVIDFGIARALDATGHTSTGDVLGTVAWMAPEQLRGERAGPAADIFAWAMCVVFAARGRHPFPAESPAATAIRVLHDAPDMTGVPERLVPLLSRALDRDPANRPNAVEIVSALVGAEVTSLAEAEDASRRLIDGGWDAPTPPPLPPPLLPPPLLPPSPSQAATPAESPLPPTRHRRASRSRLLVVGAALATVAGVLATLAAVLMPGGGDREAARLNAGPVRENSAFVPDPGNPAGAPAASETAKYTGSTVPPPTAATPTVPGAVPPASAPVAGPPTQTGVPVAPTPTPGVVQPAPPAPLPPTTYLHRYYSGQDHASLTRGAPAGYQPEGAFGKLYTTGDVPGTHALYECWLGADNFTSAAADCEGQRVGGLLGWVYDSPQSSPTTVAITRCRFKGEHFDSKYSDCEGQEVEGVIGYAVAA